MEEINNKGDVQKVLSTFNLNQQIFEMKQEESWGKFGRSAKTLKKTDCQRLVLNAMKVGTEIKTHQANGPISVHCIAGKIRFSTEEDSVNLENGDLLTLEAFVKHRVEAIEESVFLLTLSPSKPAVIEH